MVEGKNAARGQWVGRTSQIKVMNFTVPEGIELRTGKYVRVRVTASLPNSLVGEMIASSPTLPVDGVTVRTAEAIDYAF